MAHIRLNTHPSQGGQAAPPVIWGARDPKLRGPVVGSVGDAAKRRRQVRDAVVEIAEELANTPTVCRTSYVHDAVITAFEAGALKHTKKSKSPVAQAELLARIVAKHAG